MSRHWLPAFAIASGIALAASVSSAATAASVTLVESCPATHDQPAVTAVGFRGAESFAAEETHVLVLIDTSASQTGNHRQRAAAALTGLLDEARAGDRFAIAAVDVACTPLSGGFHAAGAAPLKQAQLALDARTPLGSTDLVAVMEEATRQFAGTSGPHHRPPVARLGG